MAGEDRTIRLRDGRKLAYTEHGDLPGKPVFFIHGNPGSRLVRHPDETIVQGLGARVITPDRPGFGLSDFQPRRTLLDFPDDIAQLADALGLDDFAIFGVSAGGPHVAACTYKLPHRITKAAIVSGASPVNRAGAYEGMHPAWRMAFQLGKQLPSWLLRLLLWAQTRCALRDPEKMVADLAGILSDSDKEILSQPKIKAGIINRLAEAARRGVKGRVREAKVLVSPWGFRLEDIPVSVHLWYWEEDFAIPPRMGRYLEARIPNTVAHFLPGGGHLSLFDHWGEIIEPLVSDG